MKKLLPILTALALSPAAFASFHLMQIEKVIAGIDGDRSAQAIQLRMRAPDQDLVSATRVRAWDAAGTNPVLILDITADVINSPSGARVLLATPAFTSAVQAITPSFSPDFTMAHPIPFNYLAAGRLTYENDSGTILWSLSWGGSAYTGSNAGSTINDANGDFGPAFATALPGKSQARALHFTGAAFAPSTTNAANYAVSTSPATVTNNSGNSFLISASPEIEVQQSTGASLIDGRAQKNFGTVTLGMTRSKTFTIKNVGTATLTGLAITKDGANPGNFIVSPLPTSALAVGGTATFKVTFKPTAAGGRGAFMHIRSNDANENPFDIRLTGMAIP